MGTAPAQKAQQINFPVIVGKPFLIVSPEGLFISENQSARSAIEKLSRNQLSGKIYTCVFEENFVFWKLIYIYVDGKPLNKRTRERLEAKGLKPKPKFKTVAASPTEKKERKLEEAHLRKSAPNLREAFRNSWSI